MYSIVGISARDLSTEAFGQLALQANQISLRLHAFKSQWPEHQFYLLSTCHRLELLSYGPPQQTHSELRAWLTVLGIDSQAPFYAYWGEQAIKHLFSVAAGLESIIPGDDQIVQQVRQAYRIAIQTNTLGKELHGVLQAALMSAKKVRTTTQLNRGHQSIPSAGIRLAEEAIGSLHQKAALIVGAGDTSIQCAQIIHKEGGKLYFLNRTPEKALALAAQYQGQAVQVEDLPQLAASLSLITIAIDADRPVHDYREWLKDRKEATVWIDFSMPAQVDATALPKHHIHINLHHIALRQQTVLGNRKAQIPMAKTAIQQSVESFLKRQARRSLTGSNPFLKSLNPTYV